MHGNAFRRAKDSMWEITAPGLSPDKKRHIEEGKKDSFMLSPLPRGSPAQRDTLHKGEYPTSPWIPGWAYRCQVCPSEPKFQAQPCGPKHQTCSPADPGTRVAYPRTPLRFLDGQSGVGLSLPQSVKTGRGAYFFKCATFEESWIIKENWYHKRKLIKTPMTDSKKYKSMKYLKRIQNNLLKEFGELNTHTDS